MPTSSSRPGFCSSRRLRDQVPADWPATCAIAMGNAGTAPAKSVELAAQLPPGMKFVRANNAG